MRSFWNVTAILFTVFCALTDKSMAAPNSLTYQGRIVKSDGTPLEYNNVSFLFEITNVTGSCVIYREQKNGVNMTNSKGVFDVPIGTGTKLFPLSPTATLLNAFDNTLTHDCGDANNNVAGSYTPSISHTRLLRVQFHDGSGWKIINPDSEIRSVPFSAFAQSAEKLGDKSASDFFVKTGVPACNSGEFLTWNGTALSCSPVSGASGGTVTTVTSANSYVTITNNTSTPLVTLNIGTTSGTVAAGNDTRFTDARPPMGAAGGDVGGTYPTSLTVNKIKGLDVDITGLTSGQFLKYDGTKWTPASETPSPLTAKGDLLTHDGTGPLRLPVGANFKYLRANSATSSGLEYGDVSATDIASLSTTGLVKRTGAGAYSTLGVQAPLIDTGSNIGLSLGTGLKVDTGNLAVDVGTGANQIPQLDGSGKLNSSVIPAMNGIWSSSGSNIYYNTGNVGVGTTSPFYSFTVQGTSANLGIIRYGSSAYPGLKMHAISGSEGSESAIGTGRGLGTIQFSGYDGSTYNFSATSILATSTEAFTASNHGAALTFRTTANTTTTEFERMRINHNGNVGIGTTTPAATLTVMKNASADVAHFHDGYINIWTHSNTPGTANGMSIVRERGTQAAPLATQDGDRIAVINLTGYTGSAYSTGAAIYATQKGAVGAQVPVALQFGTSDGTATIAERMRIDPSGNVGIGTINPGHTLDVNGAIGFVDNLYNLGNASYISLSNSNVALAPNGAVAMTVLNGGNVGVGTASPLSKLQIGSTGMTTDYGTSFLIAGNAGCSNCAGSARMLLEDRNAGTTSVAGLAYGGNVFAIGSLNTAGSAWNNTSILTVNTSNNNVGIGTQAQDKPFTVNGDAAIGLDKAAGNIGYGNALWFRGTEPSTDSVWISKYVASSDNTTLRVNVGDEGGDYFAIGYTIGGNPGGTWNNAFTMKTDGTGWMAGTLTQASDVRLKKNVQPLTNSLEKITHLEGVTYNWIDSRKPASTQVGLIAQEVEKVYPEVVATNPDGFKSVAYQNLVAPIINALKELYAMVTNQNEKIEALEKENQELREALCEMNPQAKICQRKHE